MGQAIYYLDLDGLIVAELSDPKCADGRWWDYRLDATSLEGEQRVRDPGLWEEGGFRIVDADGVEPQPQTFVGEYAPYCDGLTDRLSFRALPPPPIRLQDRKLSTWGLASLVMLLCLVLWLLFGTP